MTLPYVSSGLTCGLNGAKTMRIVLPSTMAINSNTPLQLTITNIRNPTSFRPPGDFIIKTFTANQIFMYAQGLTSNKIANNIPSSFSSITGTYNPRILDSDITLSISFQPSI